MSNFGRKFRKQESPKKQWALKAQRSAVVFGVVETGRTLGGTLKSNSEKPAMGLIRLPSNSTDGLIAAGNVWINGVVHKDPGRVMQAGDFIAVYPDEQMYLFEDAQGRRALKMKE